MLSLKQIMEAVEILEGAVFGDRRNGTKGITERLSTCEVAVSEIKASLSRINWMVITGVILALINLIMKH